MHTNRGSHYVAAAATRQNTDRTPRVINEAPIMLFAPNRTGPNQKENSKREVLHLFQKNMTTSIVLRRLRHPRMSHPVQSITIRGKTESLFVALG